LKQQQSEDAAKAEPVVEQVVAEVKATPVAETEKPGAESA